MRSRTNLPVIVLASVMAIGGFAACGTDSPTGDVVDDATTDIGIDVGDDALNDAGDTSIPTDSTEPDSGDAQDARGFKQTATPWPAGPDSPVSGLFSTHGLTDFNRYVERIEWKFDGDEPIVQHDALAYYAIGNGHTFSMVGTDYPLSVLHETLGPDYDRPELETFPDIVFTALNFGSPVQFMTSEIGRFSKSSIVGVNNFGGGVKMSTLFVAPQTDDQTIDTAILAVVRLENTSSATYSELAIAVKPKRGGAESGTPGVLTVTKGNRRIYMVLPDAVWTQETKTFASPVFTLEPGQTRDVAIWMFTTEGEPAVDPAPQFLEKAAGLQVATVIAQTDAWWKNWFGQGLQIDLPDRKVTDLIESFLYTIKSQITHHGAMTPLSHYGEYWTRDLSGGVRMFAITSRTDEIQAMLDYHHVAACANNGFFNASRVNWPMGQPCAVTDWSSLPVMEEKTAAEAPSYVVHMYHRMFDATGDNTLIASREQMLRYALQKQAFNADFLLPFSDDETFRPAMAMNTGIGGPEFMFATEYWSWHSTLLYLAAADGLIRTLGYDATDEISVLRDNIASTIDTYYWQEDLGIFSPILKMGTLEPYVHPYEDVNLTASWMNLEDYLGWDRVRSDVDVLVSESWMPDLGIIQTNLGNLEPLMGYDLSLGLATGMTPGFTLYALARHRPDLAQQAFNVFPQVVTASGNVTEDFATRGFRPLMPAYDPDGTFGEIWARFRPWEGGQDGEAILFYLTGLYPDAAARHVSLEPHVPNNLPWADYRGLMAAGCSIDMKVTELDEDRRLHELKFTGARCEGLSVTLTTATWACGERDDCNPTVSTDDFNLEAGKAALGVAEFTVHDGTVAEFTAAAPQG